MDYGAVSIDKGKEKCLEGGYTCLPMAAAAHRLGLCVSIWRREGLARAKEKLMTSDMLHNLRIL